MQCGGMAMMPKSENRTAYEVAMSQDSAADEQRDRIIRLMAECEGERELSSALLNKTRYLRRRLRKLMRQVPV